MALTSTDKQVSSLIINKVPSEDVYQQMIAQNLVNDNEIYIVQDNDKTTIDPATATPKAAGTASAGTSLKYAREDHVHPANTTLLKYDYDENSELIGNYWESVVVGNKKLIAFARAGTSNTPKLAYSTNGAMSWSYISTPFDKLGILSACYNEFLNKFIAFSSSVIFYSTDGIIWKKGQLSSALTNNGAPANFYYPCCNGRITIACDNNNSNNICYSEDGINWSKATLSTSVDSQAFLTCYGDKFVIILYNKTQVLTSTNGSQWTVNSAHGLPTYSYSKFYKCIYRNNLYYLFTSQGIYTSSDAITWSKLATTGNLPKGQSIFYISSKGVFIGRYTSTQITYSSDAITWTTADSGAEMQESITVYFPNQNRYISFSSYTGTYTYSTDGLTWKTNQQQKIMLNNANNTECSDALWDALKLNEMLSTKIDKNYPQVNQPIQFKDSQNNIIGEIGYDVNDDMLINLPAIEDGFSKSISIESEAGTFINLGNGNKTDTIHFYGNVYINGKNPIKNMRKLTLSAANWSTSAKTYTATVSGILADATKQAIDINPVAKADNDNAVKFGVYPTAQGANTITFSCDTIPTTAINFYITYQDVNYLS